MPRRSRHIVPGAIYHLISRFVNREWFITSEQERTLYLTLLGKALHAVSWRCLGYAIMSNHIHLAMVAGHEPLANWVRIVHGTFADILNRSRNRIGSVFVRGPKDILVPESRVGHLLGYIHNNPVRAGAVSTATQSTWTSHRSYVGLDIAPIWLAVADGYRLTGANQDAFDALVQSSLEHPVLGNVESDEHLEELVDAYERRLLEAERSSRSSVDPRRIVGAVADAMGVTIEQLRSSRRGDIERRGRAATIACGQRLGCSTSMIAEALALTPQHVNRCMRISRSNEADDELVTRVLTVFETVCARQVR